MIHPGLLFLGGLLLASTRVGVSSWYGVEFDGRETANGEIFDHTRFTMAHKDWPLGRWCLVTNLANGRSATAWLNDRGPYVAGREFDCSEALASKLGFVNAGTAPLFVVRL